jgi:hypothetical protein
MYPKTEMISLMRYWLFSKRGLYNKYPTAVPIPNSARFRKLRIFCKVVVSPTKSAPRIFKNIFREKKDKASVKK